MSAQSRRVQTKQKKTEDGLRTRGEVTREALMRAVEKLVSSKGFAGVSIRDIVLEAGQKNESALQYHFGNMHGLLSALHKTRDAEIQALRRKMLSDLEHNSKNPLLRDICKLMVQPTFELAQTRADFRRYIKAFGHEVTLTDENALVLMRRKGGETVPLIGNLLRKSISHLDEAAFQRRVDGALRYISASMYHEARRANAFRGPEAQLFFSSLIDGLEGLLGAPESVETKSLISEMKTES